MYIYNTPLQPIAEKLRTGSIDLAEYIDELLSHIEKIDAEIQAFLPEPGRRERLLAEAAALENHYPDPAGRPLLYGIPVGIKDLLRVDGFPTRAGSSLDLPCLMVRKRIV